MGSRRWAKFAKYLARDGYKLHVVTIKYAGYDIINWTKDINDENIVIHRIRAGIPNFHRWDKVVMLINRLNEFTKVVEKPNLGRLNREVMKCQQLQDR